MSQNKGPKLKIPILLKMVHKFGVSEKTKTTMRCYFTLIRMAIQNKQKINMLTRKHWNLVHSCWEYKAVQPQWNYRISRQFHFWINTQKKAGTQIGICTPKFVIALQEPKGGNNKRSIDEWVNKRYIMDMTRRGL